METWKQIEGYEGLYEISSHGRARSLDRLGVDGRRLKGKILKPSLSNGRCTVTLHKDGKKKTHLVSRLVARAFVEGYVEGLDCCHNDGNPLNNHYTNLRWDTRKNNHADKLKHGTHCRGERSHNAKLTNDQVKEIRRLYATGEYLQRELAEMYGVSREAIGRIVRGERYKNV